MKLSEYARQVGVTYQTTYQWWRAGQSDTDDGLIDDLEAVSTGGGGCLWGAATPHAARRTFRRASSAVRSRQR